MSQNLKNELEIEIKNLNQLIFEIQKLKNKIGLSEPDNVSKAALGAFTSQFYNGIENIFKRIHRAYSIQLPSDDNWHLVLLNRFSEDNDFNVPIKFSKEIILKLNEYRRFRHYFFHGYSFNIKWDILFESVSDVESLMNIIIKELKKL